MLTAGKSASKTKYFVTGAVVAAAGAFAILMAVRPANAEQLATLKVLSGSVSVSIQGAQLQSATDGMSVQAGDVVETGDPGRAVIRYFDGSETRLDANTRFEVRDLHTLPNKAQSKVIKGKQSRGATFNRIVKLTDSQSRVETEAPTSTASVRGTAYSGTSNPDGTFTWRVFEGAVKITDAFGKTVIVKAGQGVIVDAEGHLLEVYDLSDEELEAEWVTYNNCKLDGINCPQVGGVKVPSPEPTELPEPQAPNQPNTPNQPNNPGGEPNAPNQPNQPANPGQPSNPGNPTNPPPTNPPPTNPPPTNPPPTNPPPTNNPLPTNTPTSEPTPTETPAPRVLTSIVVSWSPQNPVAGQIIRFVAQGFDQDGASMGNVTPGTTFTISPDGTCSGNTCRATRAGAHRVTARNGSASDVALFSVAPGPAATLTLAPSHATISPGGSQSYTATAADEFGNSLGDVTASTTFTIAPDGSCSGATCTASVAGPHTVTGTRGALNGTASLNVMTGALDSIVITPSSSSIVAGGSQTYLAEGFDEGGNSLGDVTGITAFTISPDGLEAAELSVSCEGNVCGGTAAGAYTVTGTAGNATDTSALRILPDEASSISISPATSTVPAGDGQTYTVVAFDQYGNVIGDVTGDASFSISPAGVFADEVNAFCEQNTCFAFAMGDWDITGSYEDLTSSALLTVEAGPLAAIEISPNDATITAGETVPYSAEGYDEYGNLIGDVTDTTTFSMSPDQIEAEIAEGYGCDGNVCGASDAGLYLVTATNGEAQDIATLTVEEPVVASIVVSPGTATIPAGEAQSYEAEGFDANGNSLGDVTDRTSFGIDGAGWCEGVVCGSTTAGTYTVTGYYWDAEVTDTATLTVEAGEALYVLLSPNDENTIAGVPVAYSLEAFDDFGNSLGDVTDEATFTIALSGGELAAAGGTCDGNECGATDAGWYQVQGQWNDLGDTGTLVVDPAGIDHLVLNPGTATVDVGEAQLYDAEAYDEFGNWIDDVTDETTFTMTNGSCEGRSCVSSTPGTHTVTGTFGEATGTASLTVEGEIEGTLSLEPRNSTITIGQSQTYSAVFSPEDDAAAASDVTGSTVFSFANPHHGSCEGNVCTPSQTGNNLTVHGRYAGKTATAKLKVEAAATDRPRPRGAAEQPAGETPPAASPVTPAAPTARPAVPTSPATPVVPQPAVKQPTVVTPPVAEPKLPPVVGAPKPSMPALPAMPGLPGSDKGGSRPALRVMPDATLPSPLRSNSTTEPKLEAVLPGSLTTQRKSRAASDDDTGTDTGTE